MTAQNSVNFSKLGTYYRYKMRGLSPLIILTSIFAFLSYPAGFFSVLMTVTLDQKLLAMANALGISNWQYIADEQQQAWQQLHQSKEFLDTMGQYEIWESIQTVMVFIMVLALVCLFFMGFFIILRNFRYYFQKRYVDMDLSLPISEQTRFVGDFLSGLTAYLVPHIAALGIGLGLYYRIAAIDGEISESIGLSIVPQLMLIGLLSCVMFYCLTLFVVACCGRMREAVIAPIIMNGAIPAVTAMLAFLSTANTSIDISADRAFLLPFAATSPAGLLISTLLSYNDNIYTFSSFTPHILSATEIWCAIIFAVICAAGAMAISLIRKNERVGEGYVIKPMRHIVNTSLILSITLFFCAGFFCTNYFDLSDDIIALIIALIIITFIVYIIMELISGRSFKKFHITLLKYVGTVAGSFLLGFLMTFTYGFGAENYVPSAGGTKSVVFSVYSRTQATTTYYDYNNTVTDPEIIKQIVDIHSQAIDNDIDVNDSYSYINLRLQYLKKDGYSIDRTVVINAAQAEQLLRAYIGSDDFIRDEKYDIVTSNIDSIVDIELLAAYSGDSVEEFCTALKSDLETLDFDKVFNSAGLTGREKYVTVYFSENFAKEEQTIAIYPYLEKTYALFNPNNEIEIDLSENTIAVLAKVEAAPIYGNYQWYDYDLIKSIISGGSIDEDAAQTQVYAGAYDEKTYDSPTETSTEVVSKWLVDGAVAVDINSGTFEELKSICCSNAAFYGDKYEYVYSLLIIKTNESYYDSMQYLVAPQFIDRAAEIFESCAQMQTAA